MGIFLLPERIGVMSDFMCHSDAALEGLRASENPHGYSVYKFGP